MQALQLNHEKLEQIVRELNTDFFPRIQDQDAVSVKVFYLMGKVAQLGRVWALTVGEQGADLQHYNLKAYSELIVIMTAVGLEIPYPDRPEKLEKRESIFDQFQLLFERIAALQFDDHYIEVWEALLGLGELMGFTAAQVEAEIRSTYGGDAA
ncbi:hypothetical protein CIG75_12870 [Tumebacillus algifaecis]|uniref:dUTPase n=1 Tax=Tumebacillus algifaecis TaxID=1214604 RepID=A0A223D2N3_9BACL|nr:hypothetical protein [Tumebacillus algifaecis]ASS75791.1 hypothetical protein CIG75_12870 [Tumebacillus algifaecis]